MLPSMADRAQSAMPPHPDGQSPAFCVCVPARNEAARLPALLDSLAAQDWPGVVPVVIAVNNSTDDSLDRITVARSLHVDRLDIHVAMADFPAGLAHAGSARRLAMTEGLRHLADLRMGILVSTDADARPPVGWLRAIVAAWVRGADLVGGKIVIDEEREPLPEAVSRMRQAWDRYWADVREIEDRIDPVAWDPAPRHGDHTGASLAIRAELYIACGGVPLLSAGEDLALVQAAVAMGGRLAHPADVTVRVSPRTTGRAEGGMADAMRLLFRGAKDAAPPKAPALRHWAARAAWRRQMRERPDGYARIALQEPLLPAMPNDMPLELG
jgi:cellulose synthase/poly-beta-1,6-N-acetylglucosamine synthase-like glycosyltransferase